MIRKLFVNSPVAVDAAGFLPSPLRKDLLTNPWDKRQNYQQIFGGAERFSLSPAEGERAGVRGKCLSANDPFHIPHLRSTPHPDPTAVELAKRPLNRNTLKREHQTGCGTFGVQALACLGANSTAVHPDPLPFQRGEGSDREEVANPAVSSATPLPGPFTSGRNSWQSLNMPV